MLIRIVSGLGATLLATLLAGTAALAQDPCANPGDCCVDPAACVITDRIALAGLTIDSVLPVTNIRLGTYVDGGNGLTGVAPAGFPDSTCGLSFSFTSESPESALNALDHHWLASLTDPKVVDFGVPVNTAIVFVAVDHGPFPEEGIESTVWGSDSPSLAGFPAGWTQATLTTIWQRGWEEPLECEPGDNADDFTGQYSFPGEGFRYVAVHANFSISIFDDPSHATWMTSQDESSAVPGWQSPDDEIDAIGTPEVCNEIIADAGSDQEAVVGEDVCFDGSASTAVDRISSFGWDLDDDGEVDASGPEVCVLCEAVGEVNAQLFVTDAAGCVEADTVTGTCATTTSTTTSTTTTTTSTTTSTSTTTTTTSTTTVPTTTTTTLPPIVGCTDSPCGRGGRKVNICHVPASCDVPPRNGGNPITLCISPSAVSAHLSLHSDDSCGVCE